MHFQQLDNILTTEKIRSHLLKEKNQLLNVNYILEITAFSMKHKALARVHRPS
jgi:hypothetical protein